MLVVIVVLVLMLSHLLVLGRILVTWRERMCLVGATIRVHVSILESSKLLMGILLLGVVFERSCCGLGYLLSVGEVIRHGV